MTSSSQHDSNRYDFVSIETKWQKHWLSENTFKVSEDSSRKKYYLLEMFPSLPAGFTWDMFGIIQLVM